MNNIRIGESGETWTYYLYDEEGTLPGPGVFTSDEYAQFNQVRSAWEAWQERLREAHRVQAMKDEKFREDEKERAEFERLKAKFGS